MRAAVVLVLILICGATHAEEAVVYGMQMPLTGAFKIAKSEISCYAMNDNMCYDGRAWHVIYPLGPRHYTKPTTDTVACVAIMKVTHDCWDGANWYRLPPGTLNGLTNSITGTFSTAPLR